MPTLEEILSDSGYQALNPGEAIAASNATIRFAQGLEAKEGETAAEQATGKSAKEAFLKKYGIE